MDNVVRAMITLFVVSNNEGWPDVMYAYGDATGVETGPKPGAGMGNCFFFVGFVFPGIPGVRSQHQSAKIEPIH